MKVLNFGSLNLDYIYTIEGGVTSAETETGISGTGRGAQTAGGFREAVKRRVSCGGKGFYQSVALARAGVEVYHAGMVGEGGELLIGQCEKENIEIHYIWKLPGVCGHTVTEETKGASKHILLYGGANRKFTANYIDEVLADFRSEDIVLVQNGINMVDYIMEAAAAKGMKIVLNPSPYRENLKDCDLSKANVCILNEQDAAALTGRRELESVLSELQARMPHTEIILTLGENGCVYQDAERRFYQEGYPVPAVDTALAGDVFTAYFIAAVTGGLDVREGLIIASKAAAIAVMREGGMEAIPFREEVLELEIG